jgi:hypothetical protein
VGRALLSVVLAACGRFGFDEGEPIVDAPADAAVDAARCGRGTTAPATVHVRGTAFRYTSFDNDRVPLAAVTIEASATTNGPAIATTMSGPDGTYDLAIGTGGVAPAISVRYTLGTDFVTHVVFDAPLDRDVMGPNGDVLVLGDGPVWNLTQMNQIFSAAGYTRDATRTWVNVAVRDCFDVPIAGATVAFAPAPDAVVYQGNDGRPTPGLTETQTRYGQAFAVNAEGGMTTITVTHPTRTFEPFSITLIPGATNMVTVARASD